MITIHDSEVTITFSERERLIKAIAAAMRWKAQARGDCDDDDISVITLARLIEKLVIIDD